MDKPIMTSHVARILNLSSDRVRQLEKRGTLKAERTASGVRLFNAGQVAKVAEARRVRARSPAEQIPLFAESELPTESKRAYRQRVTLTK
jgi:DNA-binding transcriptional MerR regulator